jgi:two-component system, chemotaxis family, protein-glutamate methylesterase/glutaminase
MTARASNIGKSASGSKPPIRVMLVDDSQVTRAIFSRLLAGHAEIHVVAQAEDSESAIGILKAQQVDIILLDIEMPRRSGLEALPDIVRAARQAKIIIVSSHAQKNGAAALKALSLGACDTLAKPGRSGAVHGTFANALIDKVMRLGREVASAAPVLNDNEGQVPKLYATPDCIAIGASTGGIPAIFEIIRTLDASLLCPVFVVQHLPEAFMDFFAQQMRRYTDRLVSVAEAGAEVRPGHIYVAPGNAHLVCRRIRHKIVLDHLPGGDAHHYCPSVDVLFTSIAKVYGAKALAIVLSGMGHDGAAGARVLASRGAPIIVQDEASCVVWGMPGSVARENLATAILPPRKIAEMLNGTTGL